MQDYRTCLSNEMMLPELRAQCGEILAQAMSKRSGVAFQGPPIMPTTDRGVSVHRGGTLM